MIHSTKNSKPFRIGGIFLEKGLSFGGGIIHHPPPAVIRSFRSKHQLTPRIVGNG